MTEEKNINTNMKAGGFLRHNRKTGANALNLNFIVKLTKNLLIDFQETR